MKTKLLLLFLFIATIINAQPTVAIASLPFQDNPTSKNIAYFAVNFSEPVAGFTESDIQVSGTSGVSNAFIKIINCMVETQNFIVGVTGMWANGSIFVSVPANAVASLSEGTGNTASNESQITFIPPTVECYSLASDVTTSLATFYYPAIGYNPEPACYSHPICYSVLNGGVYGQYRALRYVNTTGSTLCLNVSVAQMGSTCYPFHIYKDNLPVVDDFSYIERWIGGNANAVTEDITPAIVGGWTRRYAQAQVEAGQTFYVVVKTSNTDFAVSTNLDCAALNYLATTDFETQNKFTISPNPSTGIYNISSEKAIDNIIVYNTLGQKIMTTTLQQIDISNQPAGIYLAEIKSENQKSIQKIIKN